LSFSANGHADNDHDCASPKHALTEEEFTAQHALSEQLCIVSTASSTSNSTPYSVSDRTLTAGATPGYLPRKKDRARAKKTGKKSQEEPEDDIDFEASADGDDGAV